MNQKWDERYRDQAFAYGKEPNVFFKEWLLKFEPGSVLMPADGEGRNGVFAARVGWTVTSFDLSVEGKSKALQLAKENHVDLEYCVGDLEHLEFGNETFGAIGLIYAHFQGNKKSLYHRKLNNYLKPGGIIIVEAFSKRHLDFNTINPEIGGPKDIDVLYSESEILTDFKNYEIVMLAEQEIFLNEGKYHNGKGAVIRFVGRKHS